MSKDFVFVSKGTEISLGKFVLEHFTLLTLDVQTGVVSNEDRMREDRGNKNRSPGVTQLWFMKRRWKNPSGSTDQTTGW